jgi:type II secretory pathway predicted ATPase ExeA
LSSLYLDHFRLSEAPFGITPNGRFFFAGRTHGAILEALQHAVLDEDGIIVVVGEVGSGKTMLCRMLADQLPRDRVDLVYLSNPSFGPREILHSMLADWGLQVAPDQPPLLAIQDALIQRHAQGRRVVVLIDEAQAMSPESLEEIKLLSNLETAQHKLLQIVLFGQPELDALLALPRLRQVRDRVVHRFDLTPLDPDDAMAYVDHRLRRAGWTGGALFESKALRQLVQASGGRVRAIHLLADKALLAAFAQGNRQILKTHVRRAVAEFRPGTSSFWGRLGWGWNAHSVLLAMVAVGTVLVVGMGLGYALSQHGGPVTMASAPVSAPVPAPVPAPSPSTVPTPALTPVSAPVSTPAPVASPAPVAVVTPVPVVAAQPVAAPAEQVVQKATMSVSNTLGTPSTQPLAERYAALPAALREVVLTTRAVLDDPAQQGWTLQIGLAESAPAASRLLGGVQKSLPVWLHDRQYAGRSAAWAVYAGRFTSRDEALAALRSLPPALQSTRPLVRTFSGIRSESYPEHSPS